MSKDEIEWKEAVGKCFDRLAVNWNDKHEWISKINNGESERLLKLIPTMIPSGSIVADVGCGTGKATKEVLKISDVKIFSVDSSEYMLKVLKENICSNNVIPVLTDAERFNSPEKLDCILLLQVLHHLYSPFTVLNHLKENLKSGGRIIILVPGKRHLNEIFSYSDENDVLGRYSVNKLCQLAHTCNLLVDRVYDDDFQMTFDNMESLNNFINSTSLGYKINNYKHPITKENIEDNVETPCLHGNYITVVLKTNTPSEYAKRTKEAYKIWSPNYSQVVLKKISDRGYSYDKLAELICNGLNSTNENILEIGMGTGLVGQRVKQLLPKVKLTGLDVSESMINQCPWQGCYDKILIEDIFELPLNENYTAIYSTFMLHHMYALYDGLQYMHEVLENEGTIKIVDLVLQNDDYTANSLSEHCTTHEFNAGVNYYTVEELLNLLHLVGFGNLHYSKVGDTKGFTHYIFEGKKHNV
ncbi:class I SAM-dependent methyltransferase [Streptococcus equinus]|uniref:methyltransferase domain-containing protein n=1 Tax=Streptococcus equinus TaxID=1335 RepID=UPI00051BAD65|nr:methyltransferase domain-containing protein [Streptococcus equinus]